MRKGFGPTWSAASPTATRRGRLFERLCVLNITFKTITRDDGSWHPDVYQFDVTSPNENIFVFGIRGLDADCQMLFQGDGQTALKDACFINVMLATRRVLCVPVLSGADHLLIWHCHIGQTLRFETAGGDADRRQHPELLRRIAAGHDRRRASRRSRPRRHRPSVPGRRRRSSARTPSLARRRRGKTRPAATIGCSRLIQATRPARPSPSSTTSTAAERRATPRRRTRARSPTLRIRRSASSTRQARRATRGQPSRRSRC
jgi:hypothetical protein